MPRIRRKGHRLQAQLTDGQFFDLVLGTGGRSAFPSDAARRAAWEAHKHDLIHAIAPKKPAAWWSYQVTPAQPEGRCRE